MGRHHELVSLPQPDYGIISLTQPRRTLGDDIENRPKISREPRDDAQDLGCRCLLIPGFGERSFEFADSVGSPGPHARTLHVLLWSATRTLHASSLISASPCSSQNRMSISRYIVVAVVRWS